MSTDRKQVKQFILESIDFDGYGINPATDNEKIVAAMNVCRDEVGHIERKEGRQVMVAHWFSSLCSVISLPYLYADIIPLAVKWGSIPANHTDAQAEKICINWWNYMAAQFCQMCDKASH
jgi:hypothetical protein